MSRQFPKIAFYVCATIFINGCKEKPKPLTLVPDVAVVEATQRTVPIYSDYVGQTFGETDVEIQSRVDGWITGIHFKEGDVVKKGQLLYTIDDLPIRNRVDQANAQLSQAITMKVKNKADLDRVQPLTAMKALSQRDLDAAIAAYNASVSQVDAATAALRNAQLELDYSRIKAPISGIIGLTKKQVGDFVGRMGPGTALNTISSVEDVKVRFSITEDEYLKFARRKIEAGNKQINQNIPVSLLLSDGNPYGVQGSINLANRQVDAATGSLLVQAVFPNSQGLLRPGQYVKVRFQTDIFTDVVMIPQQSINQLQNIYQVFVLNDSNQLAPRIVKTGRRVGSNWIVTEGLKAGEKVAIVGSAFLKPSTVVKPSVVNWNYDSTSRQ